MKTLLSFLIFVTLGAASISNAQDAEPTLGEVTVELTKAYVPQGFDNNDVTKIVVEGVFRNSCYRLGPTEVDLNRSTSEITITQKAYLYKGICLMVLVPYSKTVDLGILTSTGRYQIFDGKKQKPLGILPIRRSANSGPDDFIYANIDDAHIAVGENGDRYVVLAGQMPSKCWELVETRVILEGDDVLTVLPIMQLKTEEECSDKPKKFTATKELSDLNVGRFLLNVRSLNGQSVHKLFDIEAEERIVE